MAKVYHVSGHLDVTAEEFAEHYIPRLEAALAEGATFVVGDARGADLLAQQWLKDHGATCTVYHPWTDPRHNVGWPTVGGFPSYNQRDKACTLASDDDIAWIRPGREKSGTARNLARRKKLNK